MEEQRHCIHMNINLCMAPERPWLTSACTLMVHVVLSSDCRHPVKSVLNSQWSTNVFLLRLPDLLGITAERFSRAKAPLLKALSQLTLKMLKTVDISKVVFEELLEPRDAGGGSG